MSGWRNPVLSCFDGVTPFDYLTQLLEHSHELADHPADWMPWNYQQTLQRSVASSVSDSPAPPR